MRKALQTEQGKSDMESRIQGLEADCKDYERQVWQGRLPPSAYTGQAVLLLPGRWGLPYGECAAAGE